MDIHAGIIAASILIIVAAVFVIRAAIRVMQSARKLSFYSLRRMHNRNAWQIIFLCLVFVCLRILASILWRANDLWTISRPRSRRRSRRPLP